MKLLELLKAEFANFGKYEKIIFPIIIIAIFVISFVTNDNKIALVSAVCGISATILAGKGRISCYYIGMISVICYSYLSFINGFYGNLALNVIYYFPMEIVGIIKWRKHFKKETREIIKTELSVKERILYCIITLLLSSVLIFILSYTGDKNPVIDAITTCFSVLALILTVKRCIEQWYVWFIVNLLAVIMWLSAYINGSNCLATVLMWSIYLCLGVYFLKEWQKEI